MGTRARHLRPGLVLALVGSLALLILVGCAGGSSPQSTLSASGPIADSLRRLYWLVIGITGAIFVLVEGLLIYAAVRFRRRPGQGRPVPVHGNTKLEIAWTIAPAIVLLAIAVPTFVTMARLSRPATAADTVKITVVGHQWWWEFRYPELDVVTANEMYMPVGRPVEIRLQTADVIHSFWVPRLGGKLDLIPNRINVIPNFQADEPGVYYGQCAEFCGEGHALMKLKVVAQPEEEFEAWVQGMRSVPSPMTGLAQEGGEIFIQRGCSACHSIRGAGAVGAFGPNLTQFGARTTLAAGTLENTRDNLYRWLEDPQGVKPGAQMPNLRLNDHDIIRLVSYLRNLKPELSQAPPVAGQTPTPGAPIPTDPEAGKRLFIAKGCTACHTVQGLPGALGTIGPELTHVASNQSIVDGKLAPVDYENLKRWLHDPPAVKPGTLMPKLGLTDDELSALVAYLLTLK